MAEQLFGLDINIDDRVWWNFSSHPLRKTPAGTVSAPLLEQTQAKTVESNPNASQTIEEVVQGSDSFDTKVTKLFQGDFRVDPTTKPKHHLLINFEDKEGVPLILAMPTFTTQDIYNHFNPKPKQIEEEVVPKPVIVPVVEEIIVTQPAPIDLTQQPIADLPVAEPIIETRSEPVVIPEPEPAVLVENKKIEVEEKPIAGGDLNIPTTPVTPITPIFTPTQQEVLAEPKAVVAEPEKILKRVNFNGQLLGDNLLKKIVFDSFHYVKVNKVREEPSFLWERFQQRQSFGRALSELSTKNGANYMFKAYFTEGVIRSPYLLNRYFRNPVVLKNDE